MDGIGNWHSNFDILFILHEFNILYGNMIVWCINCLSSRNHSHLMLVLNSSTNMVLYIFLNKVGKIKSYASFDIHKIKAYCCIFVANIWKLHSNRTEKHAKAGDTTACNTLIWTNPISLQWPAYQLVRIDGGRSRNCSGQSSPWCTMWPHLSQQILWIQTKFSWMQQACELI